MESIEKIFPAPSEQARALLEGRKYAEYGLPCREERCALRKLTSGAPANAPVVVVAGDAAPTWLGESSHYTTRTGRRIQHPSAYSKSGWSSMVYHPSTQRVEVGRGWLDAWRRAGGVYRSSIKEEV